MRRLSPAPTRGLILWIIVAALLPITLALDLRLGVLWLFAGLTAVALRWPLETLGVALFSQFFPVAGLFSGSIESAANIDGMRLLGFGALLGVIAVSFALRPPDRLSAAWFGFVVFYGLSLIWTSTPTEGLRFFIRLAIPAGLYFVARTLDLRGVLAQTWRAGAVVLSLLAFLLFVLDPTSPGYVVDESFRYTIPFGGYFPAAFAMLSAALAIHFLVRALETRRMGPFVAFLLFAVQTAATQTRIVVAALAIASFAILIAFQRSRPARALWVVGGLVVATAALALSQDLFSWFALRRGGSIVASGSALLDLVDLRGRLLLWNTVLESYRSANPFFGAGAGTSAAAISALSLPIQLSAPHEEYLRILADTGLVGVALFVVWGYAVLARSVRALKADHLDKQPAAAAYEPLAIALMLFITALTDNSLEYYLLLPTYLALVLATAQHEHRAGSTPSSQAVIQVA